MIGVTTINSAAQVLRNMALRQRYLAEGVERGLKLAGLHLQKASQKKVPVEFGVLKNSAFTRAEGKGWDTVVTVGYTAAYAAAVHEKVAMVLKGQKRPTKGRYWDPQGKAQAKFLEEPFKTERDTLRGIVFTAAKI